MRDAVVVMAWLAAFLAVIVFAAALHREWPKTSPLAALGIAARESGIIVARGVAAVAFLGGLYYGFFVAVEWVFAEHKSPLLNWLAIGVRALLSLGVLCVLLYALFQILYSEEVRIYVAERSKRATLTLVVRFIAALSIWTVLAVFAWEHRPWPH